MAFGFYYAAYMVDIPVFGAYQYGAVAGAQETARGRQLRYRVPVFAERGDHGVAVFFIDYRKYKFHCFNPPFLLYKTLLHVMVFFQCFIFTGKHLNRAKANIHGCA